MGPLIFSKLIFSLKGTHHSFFLPPFLLFLSNRNNDVSYDIKKIIHDCVYPPPQPPPHPLSDKQMWESKTKRSGVPPQCQEPQVGFLTLRHLPQCYQKASVPLVLSKAPQRWGGAFFYPPPPQHLHTVRVFPPLIENITVLTHRLREGMVLIGYRTTPSLSTLIKGWVTLHTRFRGETRRSSGETPAGILNIFPGVESYISREYISYQGAQKFGHNPHDYLYPQLSPVDHCWVSPVNMTDLKPSQCNETYMVVFCISSMSTKVFDYVFLTKHSFSV